MWRPCSFCEKSGSCYGVANAGSFGGQKALRSTASMKVHLVWGQAKEINEESVEAANDEVAREAKGATVPERAERNSEGTGELIV